MSMDAFFSLLTFSLISERAGIPVDGVEQKGAYFTAVSVHCSYRPLATVWANKGFRGTTIGKLVGDLNGNIVAREG
jgi:hypothetical protein